MSRFPDKHKSDIPQQMKICYKSNRKSRLRTGDCDLSSNDEETSCSPLSSSSTTSATTSTAPCALRVKDKAAREVTYHRHRGGPPPLFR